MQEIQIISHEYQGSLVYQREENGYINLNQMADVAEKRIDNWLRLQETQDLISEFNKQQNLHSSDLRNVDLPLTTSCARVDRGGGTWAHPDIAIQFAQWCSPAFALQVSRWVREWITTGQNPISQPQSTRPLPQPDLHSTNLPSPAIEERLNTLGQSFQALGLTGSPQGIDLARRCVEMVLSEETGQPKAKRSRQRQRERSPKPVRETPREKVIKLSKKQGWVSYRTIQIKHWAKTADEARALLQEFADEGLGELRRNSEKNWDWRLSHQDG